MIIKFVANIDIRGIRLLHKPLSCSRYLAAPPCRFLHATIPVINGNNEYAGPSCSDVRRICVQEFGTKNKKIVGFVVDAKTGKIVREKKRATSDQKPAATPTLQDIIRKVTTSTENILQHFLPKDHPSSVTPTYNQYVKWTVIASIASSVSGVLSMQSLLYAIGIGAGAIPLAAALNWVIKDGLGQLGGVLFASVVNNRFDSDPKRWRMISALALDASTMLEVLTPLLPGFFLPIASVANIGKNVSWLSASATRAAVHQSFAIKENLADITAKAGSQTIASSIIGTGVGIGISPIIGPSTGAVFAAFGIFSAVHLTCNYLALRQVVLPTLNQQRTFLLLDYYMKTGSIASPDEIAHRESILAQPALHMHVSQPLEALELKEQDLAQLSALLSKEKYIIWMRDHAQQDPNLSSIMLANAQPPDLLRAHMHAWLTSDMLEELKATKKSLPPRIEILEASYKKMARQEAGKPSLAQEFLDRLESSPWHTKHLFLESSVVRLRVEQW